MTFTPQRLAIEDISRSDPGIVTTSIPHLLATGCVVRLHVPKNYGMYQLNNVISIITVLSNNSFSLQYTQTPIVNVDTRLYSPFTIPNNPSFTAEVIPIGSGPTPIHSPEVYERNGVADSMLYDQVLNNSTVEIPF